MKYVVKRNHCDCHPETCGCDPYKVVDENNKTFVTVYNKDKAFSIAEALSESK